MCRVQVFLLSKFEIDAPTGLANGLYCAVGGALVLINVLLLLPADFFFKSHLFQNFLLGILSVSNGLDPYQD